MISSWNGSFGKLLARCWDKFHPLCHENTRVCERTAHTGGCSQVVHTLWGGLAGWVFPFLYNDCCSKLSHMKWSRTMPLSCLLCRYGQEKPWSKPWQAAFFGKLLGNASSSFCQFAEAAGFLSSWPLPSFCFSCSISFLSFDSPTSKNLCDYAGP